MQQLISKVPIHSFLQKKLLSFRKNSYRIIYIHLVGSKIPDYYNYNSFLLTPQDFRKIIRFYKNNYKIISINEAVNRVENNKSLEGYLSLTTDDGYVENYSIIAPICIEEKVPITIFISTNAIDNKNLLWNNKLIYLHNTIQYPILNNAMLYLSNEFNLQKPKKNENLIAWSMRTWDMKSKEKLSDIIWEKSTSQLVMEFLNKRKPYLTVAQIKELFTVKDFITIGSHSKSHPMFNKLDYNEIKDEILGSLNYLKEITGTKSNLFAYPYGLRPNSNIENKFINENTNQIKTLLGIKNNLRNYDNPYVWERDRQEFDYNLSVFRFIFLPILRYYLK